MKLGTEVTLKDGKRGTICNRFPDGRYGVMVEGRLRIVAKMASQGVNRNWQGLPPRPKKRNPHKAPEAIAKVTARQKELAAEIGVSWQRVVELATANELGIDETLEALR